MENLPDRNKEKGEEEGGGRERGEGRRFDVTFVGRIWRRIDARERRRCNPTEGHRTAVAALPAATTAPRTAKRRQLLQLHVAFTTAPHGEIITGVATGRRPLVSTLRPRLRPPTPTPSHPPPPRINILLIRGDNAR